jgi:hypothetical protein
MRVSFDGAPDPPIVVQARGPLRIGLVSTPRLLRLAPSAAAKQKRLAALLAGRDPAALGLPDAVADAQALGSLALAGFDYSWEQATAHRRGGEAPPPLAALQRAQQVVAPGAPISVAALLAWHGAATGGEGRLRGAERAREGGPPPAPAALVRGRLEILEQWLNMPSARELKPAEAGALVLARIVEILPFDDANGRVSRLAASHAMVRAGGRPPILVAGDDARLREVLQHALRLATEPLAALLDEAAERGLDVMIQTLQRS